jgi:hypothetical protein
LHNAIFIFGKGEFSDVRFEYGNIIFMKLL